MSNKKLSTKLRQMKLNTKGVVLPASLQIGVIEE